MVAGLNLCAKRDILLYYRRENVVLHDKMNLKNVFRISSVNTVEIANIMYQL